MGKGRGSDDVWGQHDLLHGEVTLSSRPYAFFQTFYMVTHDAGCLQ